MEYLNFDIRIGPGRPYLVIAGQQQVGEAEGVLSLDPQAPEIRDALSQLAGRQTDHARLTAFGELLYQYLFTREISEKFEQATGYGLAQNGKGIRVRLRISPPELAVIPWELLHTPSKFFLGTDQKSPIVRWLHVPMPIKSLHAKLPLGVLLVVPDIIELFAALEVEKEIEAIKGALEVMKKEVRLRVLTGKVTLDRIGHHLIDTPFQVIHFIGHAEFREDTGRILLNSDQGGMTWVNEDRFAGQLKNHEALKLVVLNACQGATISGTQAFVGMAPKLVQAGIPAVVAMQYPIYDTAALLFAREFYYALFKGGNAGRVDWALTHARNILMRDFPDQREIATPVLFLRAPEGVLFHKDRGKGLRGAVFSKEALDTEKAITATHLYNQSFADDLEASQDRDLPEHLAKDLHDFQRFKAQQAFRNKLVVASAVIGLLFVTFFWTGFLDLFRFDTLLEGLTLAAGHASDRHDGDYNAVIVAIDDEVHATWRERYARLVDRLAEAGAKVVAFDMTFEHNADRPAADQIKRATQKFAAAIEKARRLETEVVLGYRAFDHGQPAIEEPLRAALGANGLGAICLSSKLGYVVVAPIATSPAGSALPSGTPHPSLSLAALLAFKGAKEFSINWQQKTIDLAPLDIGSIPFSEKRTARGGGCQANEPGSANADLFFDLTPADVVRNNRHSVTFGRVMAEEDASIRRNLFAGKVVFVGQRSKDESFKVFDLKHGSRYGVELHADSFNTILRSLSGGRIVRPLAAGWQLLLLTALILLGLFIRLWIKPGADRWRLVVVICFPPAYAAAVFFLSISQRLLIDWLYHLAGFFFAYYISGRIERRWLQ